MKKRQRTPEEEEFYRQIIEARKSLTAIGLVIDSGRRRRNPETGELEIVWVITPGVQLDDDGNVIMH